ncbi:MAG: phosphate starvation-inducible protein PhoH [Gammaproteobacteria bacterium]|nr:phosphate starvation-inducible protein PhoH [Gammaproteobacteria bacterium]|tara:strand:+ start:2606 stop:3559 length:954 start_codon:yes stop_codon:yes gene_type:complete
MDKVEVLLEPEDNAKLANLCGPLNNNIKHIELKFDVEINHRGSMFCLHGNKPNVEFASKALKSLYNVAGDIELSNDNLNAVLQENNISEVNNKVKNSTNGQIKVRKNIIKLRSSNQKSYVDAIKKNDMVFSIGAAGSGKTFLAVACALEYYSKGLVDKILLIRPAVEAGENLGFLPGDLLQKTDPYLKPMYDALQHVGGEDYINKLLIKNVIEVSPLAYMRGRTLNKSFAILDEAQNTTKEQMKMFLTRLGYDSKSVITGDITQIDLPNKKISGLVHVLPIVKNIKGIEICSFSSSDVIRHPLVAKIIDAYQKEGDK